MAGTKPDVLIAVMGLTGSGKSTFINLATQSEKKLNVGHSIQSCTDTVDAAEPFDLDGRRVILFDTPGFDDTNKSETEILRIIAFELEKQYRKDMKLHGIIYVHRISDVRVGGLAKTNFGIFRNICGGKSLKNVVIVTNMWSKVSEEEGMRRVTELASLDDFFKPALEKQAVMMHHTHDTVESAHKIIRRILQNHPEPLIIQEELVDEKKDIDQTSAGMEVNKKIAIITAQYEKRLKEQIKAAEEARNERDEETRKEQLEAAEQVRKAIAKLGEDKTNQANAYKTLQSQLADTEERRRPEAAGAEERREDARARELRIYVLLPIFPDNYRTEISSIDIQPGIATAPARRPVSVPALAPRPARPAPPATYGAITSEEVFTLYNKKHQLYATLDRDHNYITLKDYIGSSRQQWIFTKVGSNWTIKSASSNQYMSLNSNGDLRARTTPTHWRIVSIGGARDGFQLYVSGTEWDGLMISTGSGKKGEKLDVYERVPEYNETWEVFH